MAGTIHLINPLEDHTGGSEHRSLTLYRLLDEASPGCVQLWCTSPPHPALAAAVPIRCIDPAVGDYPQGGTLVFVGVYFPFGDWLRLSKPRRIVLIVNLNDRAAYLEAVASLQAAGHCDFEATFTSTLLWQAMGQQGRVLHSLVDPRLFPTVQPQARAFTIGRFSRDYAFKHHPEDAIVYQDVLSRGGAVRLMGASSLRPQPKAGGALHLQAAGSLSAADFLQTLDCFFYRTDPAWFETFGRVVHEAMCSGLPVICHASVGGAEHIQHGINGFVFQSTGEALHIVDRLRQDAPWRCSIGVAARQTMLRLHGGTLRADTLQFLLR